MPQNAHIKLPFKPPPKALGTVAKPLGEVRESVAGFGNFSQKNGEISSFWAFLAFNNISTNTLYTGIYSAPPPQFSLYHI